ncbi:MAG: MraY family glycosyltransferase [Phycisphaerae bacterium]|nr:MraY family glycosyltransferase [Phycisphaerae bacterium]
MLFSAALSAALTQLVRQWSLKTDFVARPQADRYHRTVIPIGGGIAIFAAITSMLLLAIILVKFVIAPGLLPLDKSIAIHAEGFIEQTPKLLIFIGCIVAFFILGLTDDKKKLGPWIKLFIEFAVAFTAAIFAGIRVEFFIDNVFVTTCLSAFWIVLIINAVNFMDNMDGCAAGICAICASVLFVAAVFSGQVFVGALAILFIGTLAGFLFFNFPPAKIFMGDAGSMVIGFILAALTLRTTYYHEALSGKWFSVFLPIVTLAIPLYDFLSVTFLRISQGKSPFVGDTQHFSHRLKRHGLNDRQVALTLYLATLCTGLGATFLYQVNLTGAILIFIQTFLILCIVTIFESTKNDKKPDSNN